MHILKNTNFDFVRWRWHAIALSWIIVIAGLIAIGRFGVPLGVEFSGGSIVIVKFDRQTDLQQVRTALEKSLPGVGENAVVQRYGDPSSNQVMVRVPSVGAEAGGSLSQTADSVSSALKAANLGNPQVVGTEIVGPSVGRQLTRQGLLRDPLRAGRDPVLRRLPLPFQLCGRRGGRDHPRPADHPGVPGVLPLRPVAERDRRDPDDHRLLGERHDRHLRPGPREHGPQPRQAAGRDHQRLGQPDPRPHDHHRRHDAPQRPRAVLLRRGSAARLRLHDAGRDHHGHLLQRVHRRRDRADLAGTTAGHRQGRRGAGRRAPRASPRVAGRRKPRRLC